MHHVSREAGVFGEGAVHARVEHLHLGGRQVDAVELSYQRVHHALFAFGHFVASLDFGQVGNGPAGGLSQRLLCLRQLLLKLQLPLRRLRFLPRPQRLERWLLRLSLIRGCRARGRRWGGLLPGFR